MESIVKTIEEPFDCKILAFAKWQEATRKDIERAFGVLQRKFHVLVRKIEMWYIGDSACVVNTCITLHNMMVSHRIDNAQVKSEALYVYDGRLENDANNAVAGLVEAEQQRVNRRMAEMELQRQLNEIDRGECHLSYQRKAIIDSLRFQYVQQRWECLYNSEEEHHWLRNACIDELVELLSNNRRL